MGWSLSRYWQDVELGVKNLLLHKLRSFLTMLGLVFGVGSVIAILAAPMAFICLCGLVILCRADHNEFTPMFLAMYAGH